MACCLHAFYKDEDGITCYEMGITYSRYTKDAVGTKFQQKGRVIGMNKDKTC
jgi:Flp pilus assembly pilin Flp